jgi:hypothetical protein
MAENIALAFANNEDWRKTFTLKDADNNVIDLSDTTDWQLTVRKEAKPDSSVAIRATGGSAGNGWLLRKTPHSGGPTSTTSWSGNRARCCARLPGRSR